MPAAIPRAGRVAGCFGFCDCSHCSISTPLEFLPGYAPELNPTEYIWGHLKQHELPNLCPKNLWELGHFARRTLRRMRRRPTLVQAFWKQAGLFDECHYIM